MYDLNSFIDEQQNIDLLYCAFIWFLTFIFVKDDYFTISGWLTVSTPGEQACCDDMVRMILNISDVAGHNDEAYARNKVDVDEYHHKASRYLFVGNVDKNVNDSDVRKNFKEFGKILVSKYY